MLIFVGSKRCGELTGELAREALFTARHRTMVHGFRTPPHCGF
jgi:hypothetical protein